MKNGLTDKSVLVTGATSGIGLACVRLLLDAGCHVTAASRSEASGQELLASVDSSQASRLRFVRTDVSDEADVRALVHRAVDAFGRLDGAINSAGIPPAGIAVHELSADEWDRRTGINLRGMFFCLKYQIAAMREAGGGSIVAITSAGGERSIAFGSEYSAAKGGVHSLVRAAALENASLGIRVNSIMPGAVDTPMLAQATGDNPDLEDITTAAPMARVGRPEEIAHGALWLVSDHASFITGAEIPIDGGRLLL